MSKKTPKEVSRELISSREAKAQYLYDGVEITVKSNFIGEINLEEIFFDIITRKLTNQKQSVVYCNSSQPAASVPLIGGN